MTVLEVSAVLVVALVAAAVVLVVAFTVRRRSLQRGGGFDMSLRQGRRWTGGWVFGIGRFRGDDLEWFRTFSVTWRPSQVLVRRVVTVRERRRPSRQEAYDLPAGHVVMSCLVAGRELEVSMSERAETAFLAWLEAAPPGEHLVA
ncbi:MAG TPA: DUF2550 domain-containing protein [Jiangellales bacterium]|jgi:hypothetical protein|nr:DUF2550 domain-containing protein [Jiangellales bacterium]